MEDGGKSSFAVSDQNIHSQSRGRFPVSAKSHPKTNDNCRAN